MIKANNSSHMAPTVTFKNLGAVDFHHALRDFQFACTLVQVTFGHQQGHPPLLWGQAFPQGAQEVIPSRFCLRLRFKVKSASQLTDKRVIGIGLFDEIQGSLTSEAMWINFYMPRIWGNLIFVVLELVWNCNIETPSTLMPLNSPNKINDLTYILHSH